jgi:hypothetical protein
MDLEARLCWASCRVSGVVRLSRQQFRAEHCLTIVAVMQYSHAFEYLEDATLQSRMV